MTTDATLQLTTSQEAALAKLACVSPLSGAAALLCGPQGSGKSTVLGRLAADLRSRGTSVAELDLTALHTVCDRADVVLVDDAHQAATTDLADVVGACRRRTPAASLVLAGEGRLMTLVARETRVEQVVRLRASLTACPLAESAAIAARRLAGEVLADEVLRTIHEIAGGIPAGVVRLADLAAVVAASRPERPLVSDDIEAIHRRLAPRAA